MRTIFDDIEDSRIDHRYLCIPPGIHVYVRFILKRTHSDGLPRQREPFPSFSWSLNSFSTHPQAAYDTGAPVFLFFSVNGSSQALALRVASKNIRLKAEVIQSTKRGFHPFMCFFMCTRRTALMISRFSVLTHLHQLNCVLSVLFLHPVARSLVYT